jgi:hypothetical protein
VTLTTRKKRNVLFAMLFSLTAWAVAQHQLTAHFGMNPWKFVGWAMYCTPAPQVYFSLHAGTRKLDLNEVASRVGAAELARFAELRGLWGDLYGPEKLAEAALKVYPEATTLTIHVNTVVMDASVAMPEYLESAYDCGSDRNGLTSCRLVKRGRVAAARVVSSGR